jgi:tRNA nucleotidyltransferase (CCA-adding enzyme)
MQVVLTQQEEDICNLLDDFCKTKNETNTSSEPLVCRIAGGWVRDKVRVTILTP